MRRMINPMFRFLVTNGILTGATALLIMGAMMLMLDYTLAEWLELLPVFLLILVVITGFFFVIYTQGRRLLAEQERLVNVFEHITDGVMILDQDMNIVESNPAARRMLHLTGGGQGEKLNFCRICTDESGVGKLCDYDACFVHETQGPVQEVSVRTRGGGVQSVAVAASTYKDPDGRPWNILRIGELKEERREEKERIAKMMTHSILQAQERERKRISRELHDGIGQSLYSTLIHLDVIAGTLEEGEEHPAWKRIDDLQHTLRQTIEDIRHLSAELRPSVLDDMGLLAALRNYIQTFGEKFGIQVNFSYEGDRSRLPASYETALYRIAQEALTNAAKYAETDRVDVALLQDAEEVVFSVRDYGIGFDSGGLERRGVGLYSMEERAEILGGSFELDSEEGKGTTITVRLPLQGEGIVHGHSSAAGR